MREKWFSPYLLCRHAFEGCTPFLWNVRSDLTVCSDFPSLWKRWWAISWRSYVWGQLAYLNVRVVRLGGSECARFCFIHPLACEQLLFRQQFVDECEQWTWSVVWKTFCKCKCKKKKEGWKVMFLQDSVYNRVEVLKIGFVLVGSTIAWGSLSGHVTNAY